MDPFFSIQIDSDGTFTYKGFHVEVVKFMAQALHIKLNSALQFKNFYTKYLFSLLVIHLSIQILPKPT